MRKRGSSSDHVAEQTQRHRKRRMLVAASPYLPIYALLKQSISLAQTNVLPEISVNAPRLPSLDGFSDKVGGGGAMSEAALGYPKLLCSGRYCSATEMFNNADHGDMISTTEEFFKFLFESRNEIFWRNQLTLVGEFTGWLARGRLSEFPRSEFIQP